MIFPSLTALAGFASEQQGGDSMITLGERSAETVKIYFTRAQQPEIKRALPQKAQTVEEALADYQETLLPGAASYGKTILWNGRYVGDVWCYGIHREDVPDAMLSYCLFEPTLWGKGITTQAVAMFLKDAGKAHGLRTMGAFTFADNAASIGVLEKNGFHLMEEWTENGRKSCYYQCAFDTCNTRSDGGNANETERQESNRF